MTRASTPCGWLKVALEKVATVQTGYSKSASRAVREPVSVPYLRVANVQDGYIDLSEIKQINVDRAQLPRYELQIGDILLTEGGDFDKLGRGGVWQGKIRPCIHQNHVFVVRTDKQRVLPKFLSDQAGSAYGRSYFLACAKQTTNLASINSSQLKQFPVLLPPLSEQHAIVSVLSTWDRGIEHLEGLVRLKERRKRALMQQLLTGKRRFPEFISSWRILKLGDVFSERNEMNRSDLRLLSITADRGVIGREEIERKDTSNVDKRRYKRIAPGDIGYNTMRMWQGVSALSSLEGIVSPAYTIVIPGPELDREYASYLFKSPEMIHLFYRYSQGLVDDTRNLKYTNFRQIRISLPSVEEQRRIASVLKACDDELECLRNQLDALKRQKKGLMQKLLTGEVRVIAGPDDRSREE